MNEMKEVEGSHTQMLLLLSASDTYTRFERVELFPFHLFVLFCFVSVGYARTRKGKKNIYLNAIVYTSC